MKRFAIVVTTVSTALVVSCKSDKKPAERPSSSGKALSGTTPSSANPAAAPRPPRPGPKISGQGFTIELPPGFRAPRRSKRSTPNPAAGGNVDQTIWVSSGPRRAQVMVNANHYPPKVFKVQTTKHLLTAVGNDGLRLAGGKAFAAKDHQYAGHQARTTSFTIRQGRMSGFGRQMLVAKRPQLIQVLFISRSRKAIDSPRVRAMFDSLKLDDAKR